MITLHLINNDLREMKVVKHPCYQVHIFLVCKFPEINLNND